LDLTPLGLDSLLQLDQLCFHQPYSSDLWSSYLLRPQRFPIFGLSEGESLVGYVCFSVLEPEAELLRIGVVPEYRGKGIAASGLLAAHLRLSQAGVTRVLLEVRGSNTSAIKLYQKLGYVNDGMRPGYYPGDADGPAEAAVLMSLDLS